MNYIIKHRGGARVGWLNTSWPLSTFHANSEEILLDIGFSEKYVFRPEQVISIEKYGLVPFLGWGIQIKHAISDYPENIIFYCFMNPEKILDELHSLGFIAKASSAQIKERSGFPIRWEVLAFIVVAWNVLFILDFGPNFLEKKEVKFGPFIFIATAGVFVFSLCALRFKYIQELILKPGRSIGEIKDTLRLVSCISGAFALASLLGTVFMMIDKYG
jgi:hypothetical protein